MTEVHLPFPPTANTIWRSGINVNGRAIVYRATKYKAWRKEALQVLMTQKRNQPIKGRFTAVITLDDTRRRSNMDCDNRIKPCLDILQAAGLIENDSLCENASISWGKVDGCLVRLTAVEAYDGNADFARSVDESYRVIRERKAKGGEGWTG